MSLAVGEGVKNGFVKSDLWFAALMSVMADQALFASFIVDKLHGPKFYCFRFRTGMNQCTEICHFMYWGMLNSFSNLQIDNTTRTQLKSLLVEMRTKTLSSTIVGYHSLSIKANI